MAPRSSWKGHLKLSLVSAPIAIYPSTSSSEKVRINKLNRATGKRFKRTTVDSITSNIVENENANRDPSLGRATPIVGPRVAIASKMVPLLLGPH